MGKVRRFLALAALGLPLLATSAYGYAVGQRRLPQFQPRLLARSMTTA